MQTSTCSQGAAAAAVLLDALLSAQLHRVPPPCACPAGVSLAANALFDHLLGDRLSSPTGGAAGVLLVCLGVTLCTLARAPQA